eukprot:3963123-Amphidinium_carterae.1
MEQEFGAQADELDHVEGSSCAQRTLLTPSELLLQAQELKRGGLFLTKKYDTISINISTDAWLVAFHFVTAPHRSKMAALHFSLEKWEKSIKFTDTIKRASFENLLP